MIVDSHAHYDDEQFDTDRADVLKRIQEQDIVRVVNPASNLSLPESVSIIRSI